MAYRSRHALCRHAQHAESPMGSRSVGDGTMRPGFALLCCSFDAQHWREMPCLPLPPPLSKHDLQRTFPQVHSLTAALPKPAHPPLAEQSRALTGRPTSPNHSRLSTRQRSLRAQHESTSAVPCLAVAWLRPKTVGLPMPRMRPRTRIARHCMLTLLLVVNSCASAVSIPRPVRSA